MTTALDRDDWLNCPACTHSRSEHHFPNPPRSMRYNPGEKFLAATVFRNRTPEGKKG